MNLYMHVVHLCKTEGESKKSTQKLQNFFRMNVKDDRGPKIDIDIVRVFRLGELEKVQYLKICTEHM